MLKQATISGLILLSLLTGTSLYTILNPYQKTDHQRRWNKAEKGNLHPTEQIRYEVQKDLWISLETKRLHHRMTSPRSTLIAHPKGGHFTFIEKMEEMKCYLQERVEEKEKPTQQIRFIESELGTFCYSNLHFNADLVSLALFRLPGHSLQTQLDSNLAFLQGVAENVSLSFTESSPSFRAEKFKAQINPKKYE